MTLHVLFYAFGNAILRRVPRATSGCQRAPQYPTGDRPRRRRVTLRTTRLTKHLAQRRSHISSVIPASNTCLSERTCCVTVIDEETGIWGGGVAQAHWAEESQS